MTEYCSLSISGLVNVYVFAKKARPSQVSTNAVNGFFQGLVAKNWKKENTKSSGESIDRCRWMVGPVALTNFLLMPGSVDCDRNWIFVYFVNIVFLAVIPFNLLWGFPLRSAVWRTSSLVVWFLLVKLVNGLISMPRPAYYPDRQK